MQKLSTANPTDGASLPLRGIAALVGMAALWVSVFKQLLYPALFAYYRTGDEGALMAQGVYSVVLVVAAFALLVAHARLGRLLAERRGATMAVVVATGIAGGIGVALRAFYPSASVDGTLAMCVGSALSAVYLPVHFAFWASVTRLTQESGAMRSVAFSFVLFVAVYLLLTATGANTAWVSIACPFVSALMALAYSYGSMADEALAHGETGEGGPGAALVGATEIPSAVPAPPATPLPAPSAAEGAAPSHEVIPPNGLPTGFAEAFDLSEREAELAAYAHRNYSARKIAGELFIAESTVYTHLKRIYRKTDVHSKHELIELIDSWLK